MTGISICLFIHYTVYYTVELYHINPYLLQVHLSLSQENV